MVKSLAEIRDRLLQEQKDKEFSGGRDNSVYPFWNMQKGQTALVRFLPDNNDDNDFFWVERQVIKIPFSGIEGADRQADVVTVQVPCMEAYGGDCPILKEIRPWFKVSKEKGELARKYWKKRTYLFQGLVVSSPFEEENAPENPVRRFVFTSKLYDILKNALMDPDFEDLPIDYDNGFDFKLKKTQPGQYAEYTTSEYSRRSRALSQEERDAVANHGLFTLSDFIPKMPNKAELNAIIEMFDASVAGELYDPERWGEYYKPFGLDDDKPRVPAAEKSKATTPVNGAAADDEVTESAGESAEDIIATIRARQKLESKPA